MRTAVCSKHERLEPFTVLESVAFEVEHVERVGTYSTKGKPLTRVTRTFTGENAYRLRVQLECGATTSVISAAHGAQ